MKISLRAARVNAGLSIKAASEATGVSEWRLRRYESGLTIWKFEDIKRLCEAYHINPEDLRNEKENHSSTKSDVEHA